MKALWFALLLSSSFLLAEDKNGQITVQGCVARSSGDYILIQQDPSMTYQLQGSGKTKVGPYLGKQVEVTGTKSPSMSTSSDAMARMGSASPVTLTVTSIKTIAKQCVQQPAQ